MLSALSNDHWCGSGHDQLSKRCRFWCPRAAPKYGEQRRQFDGRVGTVAAFDAAAPATPECPDRRMKKLFFPLLICTLIGAQAMADSTWQRVGSGEMRWGFFALYEISLYVEKAKNIAQPEAKALEIRYLRSFSSERLVQATADQWGHIGFDHSDKTIWLTELSTLWPDVKRGDRLRFEVDAQGSNQFLFNDRPVGGIRNRDFSQAFLDIWLSPKTSEPRLRLKLLSISP